MGLACNHDCNPHALVVIPFGYAITGVHHDVWTGVGWALVLFAAVMSSIQPKLDRMARRHVEDGGD